MGPRWFSEGWLLDRCSGGTGSVDGDVEARQSFFFLSNQTELFLSLLSLVLHDRVRQGQITWSPKLSLQMPLSNLQIIDILDNDMVSSPIRFNSSV